MGAAGRGRRWHVVGSRAPGLRRRWRAGPADAVGGARPGMVRRRAFRGAAPRGRAVQHAQQPGGRGGGDPCGERRGRVVRRPQRVWPAGAGSPIPAGAPRPRRRYGPDPDRRRRGFPAGRRTVGRVRAAHRPSGTRQHQPQHGRAADGRRPARCARAVRLRSGGRTRARRTPGASWGPVRRPGGVMGAIRYAVVVPTIGRPSLARLLGTLADQDTDGGRYGPVEVIVADDRPVTRTPFAPAVGPWPERVVRSGGRGPAAARNLGWQVAAAEG